MELASTMKELVNHNPLYTEQLKQFLNYGARPCTAERC